MLFANARFSRKPEKYQFCLGKIDNFRVSNIAKIPKVCSKISKKSMFFGTSFLKPCWEHFERVLGGQNPQFSHFFRHFFEAKFKGFLGRLKNRKKSPTRGADTDFWPGPAECAEPGGEIERG